MTMETSSHSPPSDGTRAEVLVVGSGAGGAVTALELATAGRDVLILEEGRSDPATDYGLSQPQAMERLYRRRGMTPILGSVPIGYVEGRCVGGSTEINSGFWHRTPPEVLLRWRAQYDLAEAGADQLAPHFAWAEELTRVTPWRQALPPSSRVLARGAEAMGWTTQEVPRMAHGCVNTNACASGCPTGAKLGMSRSLLPRAMAVGARLRTGCRVRLLLSERGRVSGVLANVSGTDGTSQMVRFDAEHVFVCAGATETPTLLRRSGIKRHIGDTLRIHPMLKVGARFNETIDQQNTVLPLLQVKEFWPEITLGGAFFTPGHLAMLLSENWPEIRSRMVDYRRMAMFYVAVRGDGKGSVRHSRWGRGGSLLRYELSAQDLVNLSKGLARLASLLLAAGADEVYPCIAGVPVIRTDLDAIRWLDELVPRSALSLATVHAFSSCPIGERPDRCAADSFGKIHHYENLYVNDASILPDSPGVNPQGSVMALARRNVLRFLEETA